MKIEWWDIDRVIPYENNPRHNDDAVEKVANSLMEFGWKQSLVVDADGVLIVGHTRLKAAKSLGMEKVPVLVANDLTPSQAQAYRIADNSTSDLSSWDFELLAEEIDGLQVDFNMEDFGIDTSKMDFGLGNWFENRERNDTSHQDGNDEYNEFLDKFEAKKTTDDCYTPDLVYSAVLDLVRSEYGISEDTKIVRPFYPNGDYEHEDYSEGCVVDNPPFSLVARIIRFYTEKKIPFFVFAPTLTLFSGRNLDVCYIAADCDITYENGAKVNTSFITNLDKDNRVRTAPALNKAVMEADKRNREELAKPVNLKYKYPSHVITAAMVGGWSSLGVEFSVPRESAYQIGKLDSQAEYDKAIYGSGFLLSDECARDAERAKALEAAKALGDVVDVDPDGSVVWRLSERELAIIANLGEEQ